MWALLVQAALLLLVAYFVGVWVGCMLRNLLAPHVADAGAAAPAPADVSAPGAAEFAAVEPAVQQPLTQAGVNELPATVRHADTVSPDAPASEQPLVEASQQPLQPPKPAPVADQPPPALAPILESEPEPAVEESSSVTGPDEGLPSATGTTGAAMVAARIDQESPPPAQATAGMPPAIGPPDELVDVRGIDAATADLLNTAGVARFDQIAAWNEGDVARINRLLGRERRVQMESWIEQASLLAAGRSTTFSRARAGDVPAVAPAAVWTAVEVAPQSSPDLQPQSEPTAPPVVPVSADDLTLIRGINADTEMRLRSRMGIRTFADIANWSLADVNAANMLLASERRVQEENWIEQAQILANNGRSAYARLGGGRIALAIPSDDQGAPVTLPQVSSGELSSGEVSSGEVSTHQYGSAATPAVDPTPASPGLTETPNPVPELALVTASDQTVKAAASDDVAHFRSVKSEAYRPNVPPPATHAHDDLKRIRGVGTLIERKLNAMGYTTYADVANWSSNEVDRISQKLDFRGRIERENWIEQARILASGGQTEFSRRIDRGET